MSSSSEMEMSESTESALIESMEMQIDAMHDEIQKLHETSNKLNKKNTFQSIAKSDLIGKIIKCL